MGEGVEVFLCAFSYSTEEKCTFFSFFLLKSRDFLAIVIFIYKEKYSFLFGDSDNKKYNYNIGTTCQQ